MIIAHVISIEGELIFLAECDETPHFYKASFPDLIHFPVSSQTAALCLPLRKSCMGRLEMPGTVKPSSSHPGNIRHFSSSLEKCGN